jgi:hypothetical protein
MGFCINFLFVPFMDMFFFHSVLFFVITRLLGTEIISGNDKMHALRQGVFLEFHAKLVLKHVGTSIHHNSLIFLSRGFS